MKQVGVAIVLVVCMFTVAGCGCGRKREKLSEKMARSLVEKAMEKAIEKDGGGKTSVDLKDGKFTVKTDKGEMNFAGGEGVALPKDFPSDVYVDKSAKIKTVMSVGTGMNVSLLSSDSMSKTAEVYGEKMKAQGWEQDSQMASEEQVIVSFKKEKRQAIVTAAKTDEGTMVSLTIVKNE